LRGGQDGGSKAVMAATPTAIAIGQEGRTSKTRAATEAYSCLQLRLLMVVLASRGWSWWL